MKILREVGITVLIAVAVFSLLRLTVQSYTVVMSSMEPTFQQGEAIMVSKVAYRSSGPERGQVIIFNPPPPNEESPYPFIKRVIGLPSETVEIKDGNVFINGTALVEEYIMAPPSYTMPARELPENEYFVLGDNRNNSSDSHTGWTVPRDNIIGKAWFVYWPPSKWRVVKHYTYPELNGAGQQEMMVSHSLEGAT
ncbi:MAG: signal peptidase I [Dehalococcoidia bacterium]|nr:signal peptidase I [Dehalococcoidia bacterium]MDH4300243.1 signal peptidase I [Dehalococcoidia bacterium]MDH4367408.1 signal peptidase I [Dehalococcoidia bacterium]